MRRHVERERGREEERESQNDSEQETRTLKFELGTRNFGTRHTRNKKSI
jgi:hypothetical protein